MRYPTIAVSALVLLLGACGGSETGPVFTWEAPAAGGAFETAYEHLLQPTVGVYRGEEKLREFTQKGEREIVLREEILETGESPEIRVTYEVSRMYVPQIGKTLDLPTHGNSYDVSEKGGKRHVASPDGRALTPDEIRQVTAGFDILRRPTGVAAFLEGRPVKVGETMEISAEQAAGILGTVESKLKPDGVTLTLEKTRVEDGATIAVFAATFLAKGAPEKGLSIRAELTGEVEVLVQGNRPLRLDLAGTIHVAGTSVQDGEEVEFRGSGPMRVKMTGRYVAP